jgi:hypothetical protein
MACSSWGLRRRAAEIPHGGQKILAIVFDDDSGVDQREYTVIDGVEGHSA